MQPSLLFSDTSPEAEAVLLDGLRRMSGWRKLQVVGQLNARMRTLLLAGLRSRHPTAGPPPSFIAASGTSCSGPPLPKLRWARSRPPSPPTRSTPTQVESQPLMDEGLAVTLRCSSRCWMTWISPT